MGRIAFQEFFTDDSIAPEDQSPLNKVLTNKYFATILTLLLCYALSHKNIFRNNIQQRLRKIYLGGCDFGGILRQRNI